MALGNSYDDGLAIRLGESVGGVAEHMEDAFFVLDSATTTEPAYGFHPLVDGWDTNEEESALGMPEGNTVRTMRDYNEHAARGEDPEHREAPESVCRATRDRGAPTTTPPGVYAAGACASNIALDGSGYSAGTQLGEASYFGRRAGRQAAATAKAS